jgi:hypothetical protein
MASHLFWTDRNDLGLVLPALASLLEFSWHVDAPQLDDELSGTWHHGGPWIVVADDRGKGLRVAMAIDECWGIVFDITCPTETFPALVSLMGKINPEILKLRFCMLCGHDLSSIAQYCAQCGAMAVATK